MIIAPSFMVADELASGQLITVLAEFLAAEIPIEALYPHREHLAAKVRSFLDLLIRRLRDQARVWSRWDGSKPGASACAEPP